MSAFRSYIADDAGATAIEYAILATLIALPIIAVLTGMGTRLSGEFSSVSAGFK